MLIAVVFVAMIEKSSADDEETTSHHVESKLNLEVMDTEENYDSFLHIFFFSDTDGVQLLRRKNLFINLKN